MSQHNLRKKLSTSRKRESLTRIGTTGGRRKPTISSMKNSSRTKPHLCRKNLSAKNRGERSNTLAVLRASDDRTPHFPKDLQRRISATDGKPQERLCLYVQICNEMLAEILRDLSNEQKLSRDIQWRAFKLGLILPNWLKDIEKLIQASIRSGARRKRLLAAVKAAKVAQKAGCKFVEFTGVWRERIDHCRSENLTKCA